MTQTRWLTAAAALLLLAAAGLVRAQAPPPASCASQPNSCRARHSPCCPQTTSSAQAQGTNDSSPPAPCCEFPYSLENVEGSVTSGTSATAPCCEGCKVADLLHQFAMLYRQGKYKEAEACAKAALKLEPDSPILAAAVKLARMQRQLADDRKEWADACSGTGCTTGAACCSQSAGTAPCCTMAANGAPCCSKCGPNCSCCPKCSGTAAACSCDKSAGCKCCGDCCKGADSARTAAACPAGGCCGKCKAGKEAHVRTVIVLPMPPPLPPVPLPVAEGYAIDVGMPAPAYPCPPSGPFPAPPGAGTYTAEPCPPPYYTPVGVPPPPAPPMIRCSIVPPAPKHTPRCLVKVATEQGKCCLEVVNDGDTRMTCDSLVLKVHGSSPLTVAVGDKQVQLSNRYLKATADSVARPHGEDSLILEGNVHLEYHKDGKHTEATADRVVLGLAEDCLRIEPVTGKDAKAAHQVFGPDAIEQAFGFWLGTFR